MSTEAVAADLFQWVIFGTKFIGGILLSGAVLLYASQDKILYMPNPPGFPKTPSENPTGFNSPGDWSTSGRTGGPMSSAIPFEEHFVETEDKVSIHTWLMLQPNSNDVPTLIYFHGNAGNMGFRLRNAAEMYARSKINVLMMDYRGYGASEGTPSEKGLNLDADAVLKFACKHPKLQRSKMVVFGRSLGGAVSFSLAHRHPNLVAGVIVENTFLSVSAMVDKLMPFLTPIKWLVLNIKWDSDVKIKTLKQPIMFISGSRDTLVPPFHMTQLHGLALERDDCTPADADLYTVHDGEHNNTWEVAGYEYYRRIESFLGRVNTFPGSGQTLGQTLGSTNPTSTAKSAAAAAAIARAIASDSEEDYCFVKKDGQAGIPTMGASFSVK